MEKGSGVIFNAGTEKTPNPFVCLAAAAERRPDACAIVDAGGTRWTNQRLNAECDRMAAGLYAQGVRRGMRTVLMVPPSLRFFSLTFALFKLGAVVVLIDPGMGVAGLGRCLTEAEPQAFIGIRRAQVARKLFGWARQSIQITVGVGTRLFCDASTSSFHENGAFPVAEAAADEVAAILFTSGSTGPAKGAIYTHGIFAAQVAALGRLFDIQPGEVDLCTFPLFALFAPALGMSAVIPDMDATRPALVNPSKIFHAVEHWRCTNLFGSPALLNAVSRAAVKSGVRLPSLKRVVSAGAPVPAAVIERVTKMLAPGTPIFTPYGATECLPIACIDSATILGETRAKTETGAGVCVGRPVHEVDVAIIPVSNEPIAKWRESLRQPVGAIGEITVHGPFVSPAYYGRLEATQLAKIDDGHGGVWHRMGDLGYFDENGRLWFCGRKAHRVWTADGPLDTICCEAVFDVHPAVFRSALVGIGPAGMQTPVLCVELEADARRLDRQRLIRELLERGSQFPHTQPIQTILFHSSFPVDVRHNAKIFREKLATWAARRLARTRSEKR